MLKECDIYIYICYHITNIYYNIQRYQAHGHKIHYYYDHEEITHGYESLPPITFLEWDSLPLNCIDCALVVI